MPEQLLSLIVPVFNEQEVLEESFARMDVAMRATGHPYEIIYVNDGSRDGTMSILRRIAAGFDAGRHVPGPGTPSLHGSNPQTVADDLRERFAQALPVILKRL